MERQIYTNNDALTLVKEDREYHFTICERLGSGTISVCYKAIKQTPEGDSAKLLFHFCPKHLDIGSEAYELEKARFLDSLSQQCELGNFSETVNQTAPLLAVYRDKVTGAPWAETTWINAISLESVTPERTSLHNFIKTVSYLAEAAAGYHKRGYLLLTLKPQNVQIYTPGYGVEGVRILDFGGMVKKSVLANDKKRAETLISISKKWSAPEVISGRDPASLNEKADIYSIGSIIYSFLFDGRLPELRRDITFELNEALLSSRALKGPEERSVRCRDALTKLLQGMLAFDPSERFGDEETRAALSDIKDMLTRTDDHRIDLLEAGVPQLAEGFIKGSRDDEERRILAALDEGCSFIVVTGPGGTGKSELVLDLAQRNSDKYDFCYLTYTGDSLLRTLIKLPLQPPIKLSGKNVNGEMTEKEIYSIVRSCLKRCGRKTVLIIDNLDASNYMDTAAIQEQAEYSDLLRLPVPVIATSRYGAFAGAKVVRVRESGEISRKLLSSYLPEVPEEEIARLSDAVGKNTLASEMLGRTLSESMRSGGRNSVSFMLGALKRMADIEGAEPEKAARGYASERTTAERLSALLSVSKMNERAGSLLAFASLFPVNGIQKSLVSGMLIDDEDAFCFDQLVNTGWIKEKRVGDSEKVYLHPIITSLISEKSSKEGQDPVTGSIRTHLPAFAEALKKTVKDEEKKDGRPARLFPEDIEFAEKLSGAVLAKIHTDQMPDPVRDGAAEILFALSQHYYHLSDRSDLRVKYLSDSVILLGSTIEHKTGAEKNAARLRLASRMFYRGIACYNLDLFDRLKNDCDRALALLSSMEEPDADSVRARGKLIAQICCRKGDLLLGQGRMEMAIGEYDKAIEIAEGIDDKKEIATAYRFKGIALGDGGSIVSALRLLKRSIDNNDLKMRVYNCVGLYTDAAGLHETAWLNYKKAQEGMKELKDPNPTYLYVNMANCCAKMGRFGDAVKYASDAIFAHFRNSSRETAQEVVKLLDRDTQDVDIHMEDTHWTGTLAAFVSMCALKILCLRDGSGVNRRCAGYLTERAVSSCDDAIIGLYYDLIGQEQIDRARMDELVSALRFNKQTCGYLFVRLAEYCSLTGEHKKAYALAYAAHKLNADYNYVLGIADSADILKRSGEALKLNVPQEMIENGERCRKTLAGERRRIWELRETEFDWLFN